MKFPCVVVLLAIATGSCWSCNVKVAEKIFSTKTELDSLYLSSTGSDFKPIGGLTTLIHVTNPCAVFVHYQLTVYHSSTGYDFWTKLLVNDMNAGALLRTGTQQYKTATGFWMSNLNPGKYEFVLYYKTSRSVSISASSDYQTAVLQVMTFDDVAAVSDGIDCSLPAATLLNSYNNFGPIRSLETVLKTTYTSVLLFAYQFSISSLTESSSYFVSKLNVNSGNEETTTSTTGYMTYSNQYSLLFKSLNAGKHYGAITYRTNKATEFTDCKYNYLKNKNLYAVNLPSGCNVISVQPTATARYVSYSWRDTDLYYSLSLSSTYHVMIRYQFTATGSSTYIITRLAINSVPQKQTMSMVGRASYSNNFGFWQGSLTSGKHNIVMQHRSGSTYYHYPTYDYLTRAMEIVYCR